MSMDNAEIVMGYVTGAIEATPNVPLFEDIRKTWFVIGMKNPWIAGAYDPEFDLDSFYECKTVDELIEKFKHGNWCTGTAFHYKDMCFIQQVGGGDEWLTIRGNIAFESWSCEHVVRRDESAFRETLNRMFAADNIQLMGLKY